LCGYVGDEVFGFDEEVAGAVEADFGEVVFEAEAGALMEEAAEMFGGDIALAGEVAEADGFAVVLADVFADVVDVGGENGFGREFGGGALFLQAAVDVAEAEVDPVADGLDLCGGELGGLSPVLFPFGPGVGSADAGGVGPGGLGFGFAVFGIAVAGEEEVAENLVVDAEGVKDQPEAGGAAGGGFDIGIGEEGEAVSDAGVAVGGMAVQGAAEGAGFPAGMAEKGVSEGVEEEGVESGEAVEVFEEGPERGGTEESGAEGFLEGFGHGRSGSGEGLDSLGGSVVEVPAHAGGEDELAVEGVFEAGEAEAVRAPPGVGEEAAGDGGEEGGNGVEEEGVGPAEEEGVDEDQGGAAAEKGAVALKEKRAEENMLGNDGEERVKEENEQPKSGAFAGKIKEKIWTEEQGDKGEDRGGAGGTEEGAAEVGLERDAFEAEADGGVEKGEEQGEGGESEEDGQEGHAAAELEVDEDGGEKAVEEEAFHGEVGFAGGMTGQAGAQGVDQKRHGGIQREGRRFRICRRGRRVRTQPGRVCWSSATAQRMRVVLTRSLKCPALASSLRCRSHRWEKRRRV
jgi:hypothetical protein